MSRHSYGSSSVVSRPGAGDEVQQVDPASLSRLHDIVAPDAVPFWPPAPGWYAVLAVLAGALVFLLWRRVRRWRGDAYRRESVAALEAVAHARDWVGLAEVMKRTALAVFPRASVASLSGEAWLTFLDRTGNTTAFTDGPGRHLSTLAYDPRAAESVTDVDARRAFDVCITWVRAHSIDCREDAA